MKKIIPLLIFAFSLMAKAATPTPAYLPQYFNPWALPWNFYTISDASGTLPVTSSFSGGFTCTTAGVCTVGSNQISLSMLATQATNTVLGNATSGSAVPTALSVGGCSSSSSALIWTTNTGFGCNTAVAASTVTTNANLTGPITSSGNATAIAAQTGTGTTFAMQASPTFTGVVTTPQFNLSGAAAAAAWTTAGVGLRTTASTYTDTTSSGTVANMYVHNIAAPTVAASSSTTYTTGVNFHIAAAPANGSNVTITNGFSLLVDGATRLNGLLTSAAGLTANGAAVNLNASSNFATNIGTGSTTQAVTVGNASNTVVMPGLTTGTNADTVCMAAGGTLLIQAAACTISQRKLKENIEPLRFSALDKLMKLHPVSFTFKHTVPENPDINATRPQFGQIAEEVAAVDPRLAVYEQDGITPKSYRETAMISLLIASVQEQEKHIKRLERMLRKKTISIPHATASDYKTTKVWN